MQSLELAPAIIQYEFSRELANKTLEQARSIDIWKRSELVDDEEVQPIRTSTDIVLKDLDVHDEVFSFVGDCIDDYNTKFQCDITQIEPMSILRYGPGGLYVSHADSCWEVYRVASVLVYLNPGEYSGGETMFHLFGLKVKPDFPAVVIFPANYAYEHEALPVVDGEKIVVVSWMNDLPFGLDQETMRRVARATAP